MAELTIDDVTFTLGNRIDKARRAIGGDSMGGYGAFKLAMKHPDLFQSISGHATPFSFDAIFDQSAGENSVPQRIVKENPPHLNMSYPRPEKSITPFTFTKVQFDSLVAVLGYRPFIEGVIVDEEGDTTDYILPLYMEYKFQNPWEINPKRLGSETLLTVLMFTLGSAFSPQSGTIGGAAFDYCGADTNHHFQYNLFAWDGTEQPSSNYSNTKFAGIQVPLALPLDFETYWEIVETDFFYNNWQAFPIRPFDDAQNPNPIYECSDSQFETEIDCLTDSLLYPDLVEQNDCENAGYSWAATGISGEGYCYEVVNQWALSGFQVIAGFSENFYADGIETYIPEVDSTIQALWMKHDLYSMLDDSTSYQDALRGLNIYFDCGIYDDLDATDDQLGVNIIQHNNLFHEKMDDLNIEHEYVTYPGTYGNQLYYQMDNDLMFHFGTE